MKLSGKMVLRVFPKGIPWQPLLSSRQCPHCHNLYILLFQEWFLRAPNIFTLVASIPNKISKHWKISFDIFPIVDSPYFMWITARLQT